MGLKITRLQRDQATRLPAPPSVSTNTSSIWSARSISSGLDGNSRADFRGTGLPGRQRAFGC